MFYSDGERPKNWKPIWATFRNVMFCTGEKEHLCLSILKQYCAKKRPDYLCIKLYDLIADVFKDNRKSSLL